MRIMTVFGTRPEAIKLAPIIIELKKRNVDQVICSTGQHREMLDQVLKLFNIVPNYDLNVMKKGQSLSDITSAILSNLDEVVKAEKPDVVIVQGDTTSAFVGGIVAFYNKSKIAHVEAGLRSNNKFDPFPEEINRRLLSQIADLHFAPTKGSRQNLIDEGFNKDSIVLSGNTVIDALLFTTSKDIPFKNQSLLSVDFENKDVILLTAHRRENLDGGMENIFEAINQITKNNNVEVVFPVHLNPAIGELAKSRLGNNKAVKLLEPLDYTDLVGVMKRCKLVLTDSGGIQEEAPALGKPVLVLRRTTERPEGVVEGTAKLVGLNVEKIVGATKELLNDKVEYEKMSRAINPYGDGTAAKVIVEKIINGSY